MKLVEEIVEDCKRDGIAAIGVNSIASKGINSLRGLLQVVKSTAVDRSRKKSKVT